MLFFAFCIARVRASSKKTNTAPGLKKKDGKLKVDTLKTASRSTRFMVNLTMIDVSKSLASPQAMGQTHTVSTRPITNCELASKSEKAGSKHVAFLEDFLRKYWLPAKGIFERIPQMTKHRWPWSVECICRCAPGHCCRQNKAWKESATTNLWER